MVSLHQPISPHSFIPTSSRSKEVIQHSLDLKPNQLVSITQYYQYPKLGPPLAVGRMNVDSVALDKSDKGDDVKGKAVIVLHTWKDHLWDMGKKGDVPEPRTILPKQTEEPGTNDTQEATQSTVSGESAEQPETATQPVEGTSSEASQSASVPLTPEGEFVDMFATKQFILNSHESADVTQCFRNALLQATQDTLAKLPPSSFPMPASTLWSTHVLPARPVYVMSTNGPAGNFTFDFGASAYGTPY